MRSSSQNTRMRANSIIQDKKKRPIINNNEMKLGGEWSEKLERSQITKIKC